MILGLQMALKVLVQCWAMSWNNVQIRVCSVLLAYFNTLYQFKPVKNTESVTKNKLPYQKNTNHNKEDFILIQPTLAQAGLCKMNIPHFYSVLTTQSMSFLLNYSFLNLNSMSLTFSSNPVILSCWVSTGNFLIW